ncbi:glycosyltransferase, partial [Candidatus Woesearchaeota archaeon]|nr:glycosyltransferase [Candidatus Woesearchaeota archaeon]
VYNLTLKLKIPTVFICLKKKGYFGELLEKKGFKIYELDKKGFGFSILPRLRKIIKKESPDILHTHNTDPLHQGILASLGLNIIKVHTDHNSFANNESKKALLFSRLLSHLITKIICVTESVKKDWIKKVKADPKRLITIFNGSDLKDFDIKIDKSKEKKKLGLKEDDRLIGIVARLAPEKDIFTLIRAFKIVNKETENCKLLIVGDGPLRKKLEDFSYDNKNIKFLGMRNDIPMLMNLFDIFVLSSLHEGNSQTIREAMASSKPVVATAVGGNPELIVDEKTGLLVPKKDHEKMAQAFIRLLKDKNLRENMGNAGKKRAEKYFSIEKQAENYERLYERYVR